MEMDLFNKTDTTLVYIASTEFTKEITMEKIFTILMYIFM